MTTKMYLGGILLFFLVALYGHVNCKTPILIILKKDGEIGSVETPRYPHYEYFFTSITWELHAWGMSHLELQCTDITLTKKKFWQGAVLLTDGETVIDIGSSNFTRRLSEERFMKIQLKTGMSYARINCTVRLIRIKVDIREAPDSRELGFGPQQRSTSCPCGWTNKPNKKRIVNGGEALPNEFAFMAYLRCIRPAFSGDNYQCCTASILTKRHILTAAHCLVTYPKEDLDVVVGGHDLFNGSPNNVEQKINISETYIYKDYKKNIFLHDIGIIKLTEDIEFSQFVGPVCLPSESYDLTGQWVKALGWGKVYVYGPASRTLRKLNLKVFDIKECIRSYPELDKTERLLCFYSPEGFTCNGDSGGPMVYYDEEIDRYVQVAGVVLGGDPPSYAQPTAGFNVFLYLDWIKEVIDSESSGLSICQKV